MRSLVSASQLLGAFLEKEHDKISRNIKQADFAGELEKLSRKDADNTVSAMNAMKTRPDEESDSWANLNTKTTEKNLRTRSSQRKNSADSNTKIKALKTRAKNSERLFISQPALVESTLAGLQCPAETIKACKSIQSKEGLVSLKDLKALLDKQPGEGTSSRLGEIPAEQARELIGSIVRKSSNRTTNAANAGNEALLTSIDIKTDGSYTTDEIRELFEKILQAADEKGSLTPTASNATSGSADIASQAVTAPKTGQVESLTATILPSFVAGDEEEGLRKKSADQGKALTEEKGSKVTEVFKKASGASAEILLSKEMKEMPSQGSLSEAKNLGAVLQEPESRKLEGGEAAGKPAIDSAAPAQSKLTPNQPLDVLTSIPGESVAKAASQNLAQLSRNNPADPEMMQESVASQIQSVAVPAKEAEKQADRLSAVEPAAIRDVAESSQGSGIVTTCAENPAGDSPSEQNPNQATNLARNIKDQALKVSTDPNLVPVQFGEVIKSEGGKMAPEIRSEESVENPSAMSQESTQAADSVRTIKEQAQKVNAELKTVPVQFGEAESVSGIGDVNPGGGPLQSTRSSASMLGRLGYASQDFTNTDDLLPDANAAPVPFQPEEVSAVALQEFDGLKIPEIRSEESVENPSAMSQEPTQAADSIRTIKEQAKKVNAELKSVPVQLGEVIQSGEGEPASGLGDVNPGGGPLQSTRSAPSMLGRLGYTSQDFTNTDDLLPDANAAPVPLQPEEVSVVALQELDGLKISEDRPQLYGRDTVILAKEINKQAVGRDAEIDGAFFHAFDSRGRSGQIVLPRMENSSQNAFSYYDPYRSAELVQTCRENYESIAGGEITLEMEPEEFGKLNVKVSARGEEISASVLTENSPAKQVLLRNSNDLRQDLQDQGLTLDKFMVDVNRERAGSNNYPGGKKPGGKNMPASKVEQTTLNQVQARPGYTRTDGSRLSIFA
ncbi:MAG: flagellar hook-length control protein FliK [Syntrophobacteraceae bacterium]